MRNDHNGSLGSGAESWWNFMGHIPKHFWLFNVCKADKRLTMEFKNCIHELKSYTVHSQQTNKQTHKQRQYIFKDSVSNLSCKTELFVLHIGHRNCLDKSLKVEFQVIGDMYTWRILKPSSIICHGPETSVACWTDL